MASLMYIRRRNCWQVKYRDTDDKDAGPAVVTLGKHDGPKPRAGRKPEPPEWAKERFAELERLERDIKIGRTRPRPKAADLAGYCGQYAAEHAARNRPSSARKLRMYLATFLPVAAARGCATIQAVDAACCRAWVADRRAAWKASSTLTAKRYLAAIWAQALDDGLIAVNPWRKVKMPAVDKAAPEYWTEAEVTRIVAACRKPWLRDLVLVLAHTGLRLGTATRMRWRWVDWQAGRIAIEPAPGIKTAYACAIPDGARDVLQARDASREGDDPAGLVFATRTGRPIGTEYVWRRFDAACRRAGVPLYGPHSLRDTCAVLMLRAGVALNAVQAQLGHASLAQTAHYLKCLPHDDTRLVAFRIGGGPDQSPAQQHSSGHRPPDSQDSSQERR